MSASLPTLQRCQWRTGPAPTFNRATWRQRLTRITEDLQFFSDSDKDWILGRSIVARLSSPPAGYLTTAAQPRRPVALHRRHVRSDVGGILERKGEG